MVLGVAEHVYNNYFPSTYTSQVIAALATLYTLRTFSRGRKTSRDRDLHARTVILTSPFSSSLGITLLRELASRGTTVICLSDRVGETQDVIVSALREEFKNENIWVEACDMTSVPSIQGFVANFLKKENSHNRIDAIIFAHEYPFIGSAWTKHVGGQQYERDARSLGTFLLTTLLLPNLLVAPQERDIRIINVVNPLYAAGAKSAATSYFPSISSKEVPSKPSGPLLQEGLRSLRTIVFSRHLQRILDALPAAQIPKASAGSSSVPVVSQKSQKSNIISVSACPGFSRHDIVAHIFPDNILGTILYFLLFPLIWLFCKPSSAAVQTVLHALFLPTPFKVLSGSTDIPSQPESNAENKEDAQDQQPADRKPAVIKVRTEEVLKAGALYRECAVVPLPVPIPLPTGNTQEKESQKSKQEEDKAAEEGLELPDDQEYGGEAIGRWIWESYEDALKAWDEMSKVNESGQDQRSNDT